MTVSGKLKKTEIVFDLFSREKLFINNVIDRRNL